jgi:hypothetical protein
LLLKVIADAMLKQKSQTTDKSLATKNAAIALKLEYIFTK